MVLSRRNTTPVTQSTCLVPEPYLEET